MNLLIECFFVICRLKSESLEPVDVVKSVLDEVDALLQEVICMLQSCCQFSDSAQEKAVPLNQGLSLQLFGTNQAQVFVKDTDEFPPTYKEKMFKPPEIKPIAHLVKTELKALNKEAKSNNPELPAFINSEKRIGK